VSGVRNNGTDKLLQITAPISPGSSGGPVINGRGEVVGVAVATFREGQNLNFAVPSSYVGSLLKRMGQVQPLSAVKEIRNDTSRFERFLGTEETTRGVIGTDFRYGGYGNRNTVTLTIVNYTGSPVSDVRFLIVFWGDKKHGYHPIDYVEGRTCPDMVVLPSLARRQTSFWVKTGYTVYGTGIPAYHCDELFDWAKFTRPRTSRVDIRVLDFKFAQ
jgi:hypothetical protein